jgi:hypothetical protein
VELLIAVVEEQAQTCSGRRFPPSCANPAILPPACSMRTAGCWHKAMTGTPGHINSTALAVGHVIDHYPIPTVQPGMSSSSTIPAFRKAGVDVAYSSSKHLAPKVRVFSDFPGTKIEECAVVRGVSELAIARSACELRSGPPLLHRRRRYRRSRLA